MINKHSIIEAMLTEAKELLNSARIIDIEVNAYKESNTKFGKIITINILIGLAIELYLKSFMIAARNDGAIRGHSLQVLYNEFPDFFKNLIESRFLENFERDNKNLLIEVVGLILSTNQPSTPEKSSFGKPLNTFTNAIEQLSNTFTESRYFYENLSNEDWIYTLNYYRIASTICHTLESVLKDFLDGKLSSAKS